MEVCCKFYSKAKTLQEKTPQPPPPPLRLVIGLQCNLESIRAVKRRKHFLPCRELNSEPPVVYPSVVL
jgi:hypothetical protein